LSVEAVGIFGGDKIHGFERGESEVWGFAFDEFNENDTCGPYINKLIIKVFIDEFRGHPGGSAHNRFSFLLFLGELDGKSEISNLNIALLINKNIVTLKIPMNLFFVMEEIKSLQDLAHDIRRDILRNPFGIPIDNVGEGAAVHELDQHEEAVHVIVGAYVVYDVLVRAHRHHCRLDLYLL
jgi:hypothetical protein